MSFSGSSTTMTDFATSSLVFALEIRKSPARTLVGSGGVTPGNSCLFSSGRNLCQDTALTFKTPQLPPDLGNPSVFGLHPESESRISSPKLTHCQFAGNR